ncbi:MAG: DUF4124 domain-containing protein [Caldimonas sp.]
MVRTHLIRSIATALAAVLALITLPAEAQWKWKDKSGHVQYSDLPPPTGTPDQDILARPATQRRNASAAPFLPASAAPALGAASNPLKPRMVEPELDAKLKKADAEQAAKVKAEEDRLALAKADNCTHARAQLRTLDSGVRLARSNEKGEREILDDKQRADETKRAKDVIAGDCK